ncbi:Ig-like domain-containing protein [Martelella alba]|uniref:Big-1 domain-containing protein n=1 Tax=Martelella alba TaxID=2590451 RepID=A0ABY2SQI3_9HYPH|nr:Ig-like domain-containing protein [Martelella alba]TKI06984.1 hypothetical protein FCN80_08540 [Martelella alba]
MQHETFPIIIDGREYDLKLSATSNAAADGCESNSVTAMVTCQGAPAADRPLFFCVGGSAAFHNKTQTVKTRTDDLGQATVFFTDTVVEDVLLSCQIENITQFAQSHFGVRAAVTLSVMVVANNAPADGQSRNILEYAVRDAATGRPVLYEVVDFTVTGSATLSRGAALTDYFGSTHVEVVNTVAESVIVNARVRHTMTAVNHTLVHFREGQAQYRLTSEVRRDANGSNEVFHTLTNIATGEGVPGERMRIFCSDVHNFLHTTSRTNDNGTVREYYGRVGHDVVMFAVWEQDPAVNATFTLRAL